ncbi:S26 family signal peptidase [Nocardiopsis sp. CC223A]|uniref:S26 family signal peptidase n=1 Tax=Nocardiopsis sp. CC223A TaxID=3044051 RepID=UPI00278C3287|nr:S26 family signal peptidase [Nocardiopsis sp. CC223A]
MLTVAASAGALVLGGAAAALGALLWIRYRVFVLEVSGESMLPTLRQGDRMLAERRRRGTVIAPGRIVVLVDPQTPVLRDERNRRRRNYLVKRVVAVAGDPLPEGVPGHRGTVPEGCLVVLGDNPEGSVDSRGFGPVPVGRVVGTVLRRMEG